MSHPPTIRDIALHLGVGKSTVQRALTGSGSISSSARQRVIDAAKKLGYQPDPLFSILGSQSRRSRVTQLRVGYMSRADFAVTKKWVGVDNFPAAHTRGEELGYLVERIDPDEIGAGKRLMDVLYFRGYVGVIIGQVRSPDHEAILLNTHLPVVCCGRIDPLPMHTIQPDITQIVRLAWRRMMEAGYRRIGSALALHDPPIEDDSDRLSAILQCQEETLRKSERVPPLRTMLSDRKGFLEWFHKHQPEAILSFNIGQYYALKEDGVDMSKVGYATVHVTDEQTEFAGVVEPHDSISREALNLLDQLIRHRSLGIPAEPLHILIPGRWKDGPSLLAKSTGPAVEKK
jgi:DNA-binding LacI/PurR family transcriptional regulator